MHQDKSSAQEILQSDDVEEAWKEALALGPVPRSDTWAVKGNYSKRYQEGSYLGFCDKLLNVIDILLALKISSHPLKKNGRSLQVSLQHFRSPLPGPR